MQDNLFLAFLSALPVAANYLLETTWKELDAFYECSHDDPQWCRCAINAILLLPIPLANCSIHFSYECLANALQYKQRSLMVSLVVVGREDFEYGSPRIDRHHSNIRKQLIFHNRLIY